MCIFTSFNEGENLIEEKKEIKENNIEDKAENQETVHNIISCVFLLHFW